MGFLEFRIDHATRTSMRVERLEYGILRIETWEALPHESWCVLGGNASGKSLLGSLIAGEILPSSDEITGRPAKVSLLSFESLQSEYERELKEDDTDFMDRIDFGRSGLELLCGSGASEVQARELARDHACENLLEKRYRQFSTGELRKLSLLREILGEPDLLVLDEPYEGLDAAAREEVSTLAQKLIENGHSLLLLANRLQDVSNWCTHLALLRKGRFLAQGPVSEMLALPATRQLFALEQTRDRELPSPPPNADERSQPLLEIRNGSVAYDGVAQFEKLDWRLEAGQHTLITGPNGCGKSTLLGLITGDHPQCYRNDIHIFGFQRGSGESIWDIKRNLGIVSPALHRDYRVSATVETVAVSGFYDSIGLYEQPSSSQWALARQWLALFGLQELARKPFSSLSYGQQRLALIVRGLVKQPPLLILDEPTQGLDDLNRHLVLASLERLANLRRSTLLYVSHRMDERPAYFSHQLNFVPTPDGPARYQVVHSA